MSGSNHDQENRRLDSWKEIAAYLRRDERTAIRWEEKGMPVHRVPGGKRQAVFAYTEELDAWMRQGSSSGSQAPMSRNRGETWGIPGTAEIGDPQGLKPSTFVLDCSAGSAAPPRSELLANGTAEAVPFPSATTHAASSELSNDPAARTSRWNTGLSRGLAAVVSVVVVAVVVTALVTRHSRAESSRLPVRLGMTLNSVQGFDGENRFLWAHTFSRSVSLGAFSGAGSFSTFNGIADFRGDGKIEALVPTPFQYDPGATDPVAATSSPARASITARSRRRARSRSLRPSRNVSRISSASASSASSA